MGVVAGVLVLAAAGALLAYLTLLPERLASSYKDRAEPEHEKVEKALDPVYDTFSTKTFGENTRELARADRPGEYVRAVERVTARELKEVGPARRSIRRAERELDEIDEADLTETPDWPLLGGRGDLKEAESIAGEERDYLRKARRFLADYKRLVNWAADRLRFFRRVGLTLGRYSQNAPDNPTSPAQVTRPLRATAREIDSQVRRFKRGKPPREVDGEHRNMAAAVSFVSGQLRGLASAVDRLDLAAANRIDREFSRGFRPYDRRSRANFRRLLARSIYVRQTDDLERRERDIARAYEKL